MKNNIDLLCCAYPFLYEKNNISDYEIATDSLASYVGFAKSFCNDENLKKDIERLIELIYHSNGSVRGRCAITNEDIEYLKNKYFFYRKEIESRVDKFCLPQGGNLAGALHIARSKGKYAIRKLFFVKENGNNVDNILFDFLNIVTNYLFALSLYANKIEKLDEIEFLTKSY